MKWFDFLISWKTSATSVKKESDVATNASPESYRDIRGHRPALSFVRDVFAHKKLLTSMTMRNHVLAFCAACSRALAMGTRQHWFLLFILLMLAYLLYGVGFILRTERNIAVFREDPGSVVTDAGFARLRTMRQDYQILAPVIRNPLIPLEPLATYGRVLDIAYGIARDLDILSVAEAKLIQLRGESRTKSMFPIVEPVFAWFTSIDDEIRELYAMLSAQAPEFDLDAPFAFWKNLLAHEEIWYDLLGKNGPTRILLLNQNSDELRAGGGFPGTAFIIEFDGGKMTRFQFYDIYALDWHLRGYRPSPEGINRFRSLDYPGKPVEFEIRDANYYPRFQESAQKLDELAQEAGIGKLDLVIGINQKFLEDIVRLVEPLKLDGIGVPIDHRNVALVLSMLVEGKKTIEGTPKGTVKLLADAMLEKLIQKNQEKAAALLFVSHIYHGEFIAGSPRADVQSALDSLGIFDRWQNRPGDWVYPLFTSISRNKSDRLMERTFEINHTTSCERSLTLRQKHWFDLVEAARIRSLAHELGLDEKIKMLLPIQWGGDNVQYLRFILPPGTKILPKSDPAFTTLEDNQLFTSIHGYATTSPGTTRSMVLRYLLPEWHCGDRTEFFKQPGLRNTRVVIQKKGTSVYQKFYE